VAHYEQDLLEICPHLDADGLTRFAQVMYLMKTKNFENIWWRIENRVHELAEEKGALDSFHLTNILRSFSRSQENQMSGSDKLFVHLEPLVMENLSNFSDRDFSHVIYAYSIRAVGNPELYNAIDARLDTMAASGEILDYPTMHNLLYYLMFRESKNDKVWAHMIESTLQQEDILPLVYYKPFKFSRFFLQAHFPDWDISEYVDRFWYAEQYFN
jgi:hypothetical protein